MDEETQIIYDKIREVARNEDYIYYSSIAPLIGLDIKTNWGRKRIGAILDRINKKEHCVGRPLLSAVVIRKSANIPGAGFFRLTENLKLKPPNGDNLKFWIKEIQRVWNHWGKR